MDEFMFYWIRPLVDNGQWVLLLMVIVAIIILVLACRPVSYKDVDKFTAGIKDTRIKTRSDFQKNYGDMPNDPWKDIPKNRRGEKEWKWK